MELKTYSSRRAYWAVERVEREAGDINTLYLDDTLFYLKSEADEVFIDGSRLLAIYDGHYCNCEAEINFCPMCGRKLEEIQ
jgi:hypothetical protein